MWVLDWHSLGKGRYFWAFPPLAQGVSALLLTLPKALHSSQISCLLGYFTLSVPNFRVQSRLTITFQICPESFPSPKTGPCTALLELCNFANQARTYSIVMLTYPYHTSCSGKQHSAYQWCRQQPPPMPQIMAILGEMQQMHISSDQSHRRGSSTNQPS